MPVWSRYLQLLSACYWTPESTSAASVITPALDHTLSQAEDRLLGKRRPSITTDTDQHVLDCDDRKSCMYNSGAIRIIELNLLSLFLYWSISYSNQCDIRLLYIWVSSKRKHYILNTLVYMYILGYETRPHPCGSRWRRHRDIYGQDVCIFAYKKIKNHIPTLRYDINIKSRRQRFCTQINNNDRDRFSTQDLITTSFS